MMVNKINKVEQQKKGTAVFLYSTNTNCSLLIKWQLMHINNAITSTMKLQTRQLQIDCPVNTLPRVCSWHSQSGQV